MICGIDEAGRGCLAGSLFVCGVVCEDLILDKIENLTDSKKLTRIKRDNIYNIAMKLEIKHFVVSFNANKIDLNGISKCMRNALIKIKSNLFANKYIFDGNTNFKVNGIECLVKGDNLIKQISLASIIAKSLKDKESDELDKIYPQYKLAKNKGYGTKEHIELIKIHSLSQIHRKSFNIR
ncbi:ribonuclease HII [Helicobacter sp. MIT 14-3879]|uniref:ribonuclease HII n=1 Tax=Helicobacter sp. MIT 14-3879 TaxID=2040649 RepID=UPI000E1ECC61|nr:ribonuclease HII [Helicobacter sp. MIT 14-3879]RDU62074.1 ribonuclease HII [Helicobacter sp. MIT 14-3879]